MRMAQWGILLYCKWPSYMVFTVITHCENFVSVSKLSLNSQYNNASMDKCKYIRLILNCFHIYQHSRYIFSRCIIMSMLTPKVYICDIYRSILQKPDAVWQTAHNHKSNSKYTLPYKILCKFHICFIAWTYTIPRAQSIRLWCVRCPQ